MVCTSLLSLLHVLHTGVGHLLMRQKEGTLGGRLDFLLKLKLKDKDVTFF